jgi:hypothetical protein
MRRPQMMINAVVLDIDEADVEVPLDRKMN